MSHITQETLKTIREKKIVPESKWHFLLKNYVFWFFLVMTIFFGALAATTILFMLLDHDWDVFKYFDRSLFEEIFVSIPYFWLAVFALFLGITYFNFRHTRQGYRHEVRKVIVGGLLLSLGLGGILFTCGIDSEIHETFSKQFPFYNKLVYTKENIWIFPDKGLLSGKIIDIQNGENFTLQDFNGHIWQIKNDGINWPDNVVFLDGTRIKLIGKRGNDSIFLVKVIKPWDWNR